MEAAEAISLVTEFILWRNLDYPIEGLKAERFAAGWRVYAPVDVDELDPMGFLDTPGGHSVFLVGQSGRIEEVSSLLPPEQAQAEFSAQDLAAQNIDGGSDDSAFMDELERQFVQAASEGPAATSRFTIVDNPLGDVDVVGLSDDALTAREATRQIESIARELAQLGPAGWEEFSAEFAFTVSSQIARLRFGPDDHEGIVPVPQSIVELVRQQRELTAQTPAGPWWRLLLTVTNRGDITMDYDYGDDPFPDDQLVAREHYRNDLEAHPRSLPVWLAGYLAGPAAQGRNPRQAAAAVAADTAADRIATATAEVPALHDLWTRLAVLSAAYVGGGSERGPRIHPGYARYDDEDRSGSTLFMLPGDRAVLSGGKWNSELLDAAYNRGEALPDLYTGAPAWVNDSVLDARNRNGLLTFCFWWENGQWYRGATDTSRELDVALPAIWTPASTVRAMTSQTGPASQDQCEALLATATNQTATAGDVAALFAAKPDAEVDAAANQLSLAGLLAS